VIGRVVLYTVLTLGSLIFVAPLLWMVSASLQDLGDIFSFPPHWIPISPDLDNYSRFLFPQEGGKDESANILRWFGNGLFVAGSVTALQLFFCSLAAYAFAKRRFRGRDRIFLLFLATMMIPAQVTLIPWYIILRHIPLFGGNDITGQGGHGWLDSYYGLIIPGIVSAWTIFFLRQYMRGISDEYLDAARGRRGERVPGLPDGRPPAHQARPGGVRDLHLHLRLGGPVRAADPDLEPRPLHRAARHGAVLGQEPPGLGPPDGGRRAGHDPGSDRVRPVPAPARQGDHPRRRQGLSVGVAVDDTPAWVDDAVLYGVVPSRFGPDGLRSVTARLPDLADLGVNALWLSPIAASPPGDYGYAVTDYLAVDPRHGTADDLRDLVRAAHGHGLRVLLDIVPNHTSDRHPFFREAEAGGPGSRYWDWYDRDAAGRATHYFTWTNLPNLNFANPEVREHVLEMSRFWVREFDVDGYRVDVAWGVQERAPDFWPRWRRELKALKPDLLLIAEASARDPRYVGHGFDAAYDWTGRARSSGPGRASSTTRPASRPVCMPR
jgi:ABC-type spermidine/putrescine transport system permease subunit II